MAPKERTKCGSQCDLGARGRTNYEVDTTVNAGTTNVTVGNTTVVKEKYWLLFKSKAQNIFDKSV